MRILLRLTAYLTPLLCVLAFLSCTEEEPVKPPPAGPDTTSQEFTQETFVLGELGSLLSDVAIVNDTLAYAVGEIYAKDSTGKLDPTLYNLAIWNGSQWRLQRLYYRGITGSIGSILAISEKDIRFSVWAKWNGKEFQEVTIDPMFFGVGINKMWGTATNTFVVGNNGFIAHYNGTEWQRISSGTKADIQDVWGAYDEKTQEHVVLCAVSNQFELSERKILRIYHTGRIDSTPWRSDRTIRSIWFQSLDRIYATGDGVFFRDGNGLWEEKTGNVLPPIYSSRVRGRKNNDVFVAMNFGVSAHYNGNTWQSWTEPASYIWYSCDYKSDIYMAVGSTHNQQAVITLLRR